MGSPATHTPWGWNTPARVLLTLIAAIGAVSLCTAGSSRASAGGVPPLVVDPNTAPSAVLVALPRLGPSLVSRIVEARNAAPFRTLDDLDARVSGIGPTTMNALRPFLAIDPETLESITGAESSEPAETP